MCYMRESVGFKMRARLSVVCALVMGAPPLPPFAYNTCLFKIIIVFRNKDNDTI